DIQKELVHRQLVGETVVLPPIPFHRTMDFLSAVSAEQGIFVSPSRGESFGLSAAESIACKVPPVLSSLDAHKDLLDKVAPLYTFPVGDASALLEKIEHVFRDYENAHRHCEHLRERFSAQTFIDSWIVLMRR